MENQNIKKSIRKLFKWSLKTAMNDYPYETLNKKELQEMIVNIWDEMVQCGEIQIVE